MPFRPAVLCLALSSFLAPSSASAIHPYLAGFGGTRVAAGGSNSVATVRFGAFDSARGYNVVLNCDWLYEANAGATVAATCELYLDDVLVLAGTETVHHAAPTFVPGQITSSANRWDVFTHDIKVCGVLTGARAEVPRTCTDVTLA